jgi:RNA polymerase sigma-70 factor (ECF subfamily)
VTLCFAETLATGANRCEREDIARAGRIRQAVREGRAVFLGREGAAGVKKMMGPDELGRVIDRHAAALTLYARQWCAAPEDVVQDAFLQLARQKEAPRDVPAWLYRVVRNAAVSAARAEARRRRHEAAAAAHMPGWFTPDPTGPLDAAAVREALQGLPVEEREVIVARLWGGLTFEQVAAVAGCSSSTAHRRYLAGLSSLRERLKVPCPNTSTTKA